MDFLVAVAAKWIIGLLWILSACVWSLQSPGFIISGAWIFLDLDSLLLDWRCSFLLARIGSPVFGIVAPEILCGRRMWCPWSSIPRV